MAKNSNKTDKQNKEQEAQATENSDEAKNETKEQGAQMAKAKMLEKSISDDPLLALPRGLENIVNEDLLSINAKVDIETNPNLTIGTLLISEDYGQTFKKCPDEDISTKENIKLGILKDFAFQTGTYAVLIEGKVILSSTHESAIKKAFLQNLIIQTKE
ncbi:hypothetical protein EX128_02495 [Campylobacter jejuni]|uniref:hypothetical protein n=1 Tax=unclassified Campylobacter TaxID=2593542 RepID=UPI000874D456|nr:MULTISPECIES: hypothetical protein [unclassified Campylobacter]EAH9333979.1 hypothetical protein [Campylobacter jejuni]EAH9335667.1 hypothetical protein [Campylobacter jejuni]EAJ4373688.1 hypothetical protein [Campylobacter jejuni]EAJ5638823.1 hypothetical protein [Campylobacter jejuni]EAK1698931.1 hypothetical protein [Campylobacter jejuni]